MHEWPTTKAMNTLVFSSTEFATVERMVKRVLQNTAIVRIVGSLTNRTDLVLARTGSTLSIDDGLSSIASILACCLATRNSFDNSIKIHNNKRIKTNCMVSPKIL